MTQLDFTFLGCGDAFGSGGRFNTCFHVKAPSATFLIDCGASSMITRPAGRSMYSRLAGSGVRQSLAAEASRICCGLR